MCMCSFVWRWHRGAIERIRGAHTTWQRRTKSVASSTIAARSLPHQRRRGRRRRFAVCTENIASGQPTDRWCVRARPPPLGAPLAQHYNIALYRVYGSVARTPLRQRPFGVLSAPIRRKYCSPPPVLVGRRTASGQPSPPCPRASG